MRKGLIILTSCFILAACHQPEQVALNCASTNVQVAQNITLNTTTATPTLYVFHNTSKQAFFFNHESGRGMSAGWASQIDPDQWTAILMDKSKFALTCTLVNSAGNQTTSCAQLVQACQLQTKAALSKDNYWVAENKTQAELLAAIKARHLS